jgi:hypothetical protein
MWVFSGWFGRLEAALLLPLGRILRELWGRGK